MTCGPSVAKMSEAMNTQTQSSMLRERGDSVSSVARQGWPSIILMGKGHRLRRGERSNTKGRRDVGCEFVTKHTVTVCAVGEFKPHTRLELE